MMKRTVRTIVAGLDGVAGPLALLAWTLAALPVMAQSAIDTAMRYTVKVVTVIDQPFGHEHKGRSSGSGFLVDRERGWIVTNAHVAARSPSRIRINFRDGDPVAATKLHVDALVDLAVERLSPIGQEMRRLVNDASAIDAILFDGGERARAIAEPVIREVREIMGFLQR